MRRTIQLQVQPRIDFTALKPYQEFLFRNIGDKHRWVLGVGVERLLERPEFDASGSATDWIFGFLTYELKNSLEPLHSRLTDELGYPQSRWFVPRFVFEHDHKGTYLHVNESDASKGIALAEELFNGASSHVNERLVGWESRTSRGSYLTRVEDLLKHIHRGDIYEVNYCTTRVAHAEVDWDPFIAFGMLLERTKAEHAGFLRIGDRFALCASPERFLAFNGKQATAQPMKGTRPRHADPVVDQKLANELANDAKERAENIMALDVMRNDLSRVASSGSVKVSELCGVHAHAHVHQMTSTVTAQLREDVSQYDAVIAAFPMASMTGAPKFRAMQLIDDAEEQCRGLFSGTMGFFAPNGTADLNVVIRSLFHNSKDRTLMLVTGSAITANCDPEKEWEECELKAASVIKSLV